MGAKPATPISSDPAASEVRSSIMPASELDARIRELNAQGMNDTRMAEYLGENKFRVSDRRRNLGLPVRSDPSQAGRAGASKARAMAQTRNHKAQVKDARGSMHRFVNIDQAAMALEDREAMVRAYLARGGKVTVCPPAAVTYTTADVPTSWQLREHIKAQSGQVVGFQADQAAHAIEAEHKKLVRRRAA